MLFRSADLSLPAAHRRPRRSDVRGRASGGVFCWHHSKGARPSGARARACCVCVSNSVKLINARPGERVTTGSSLQAALKLYAIAAAATTAAAAAVVHLPPPASCTMTTLTLVRLLSWYSCALSRLLLARSASDRRAPCKRHRWAQCKRQAGAVHATGGRQVTDEPINGKPPPPRPPRRCPTVCDLAAADVSPRAPSHPRHRVRRHHPCRCVRRHYPRRYSMCAVTTPVAAYTVTTPVAVCAVGYSCRFRNMR